MMTEGEQRRFAALQKDHEYLTYEEAEGVEWVRPDHPYVLALLRTFSDLVRSGRPAVRPEDLRVSRYMLELCLQHYSLVPFPIAAVRLGMDLDSLQRTFQAMVDAGKIVPSELSVGSPTVGRKIVDDIHKQFRSLQHRIFGDHNDYCTRLHDSIANELGVKVTPSWCTTSRYRDANAKDYAYTLCMISGEPTAVHNQVYLDFGKPLRLPPDVCSRLTYARHHAQLKQFAFTDVSVDGLPTQ